MIKKVYQGKYIKVEEQTIENNVWEKVYLMDGISIYPITDDNKVLLVKEFRPHETPNIRLKPVTGIYEHEYSFFENANRELQEEIGFEAKEIEKIWEIKSNGTVNATQFFCKAKKLSPKKIPNPDGEHTITEIIEMDILELKKQLLENKIPMHSSFVGIFKL